MIGLGLLVFSKSRKAKLGFVFNLFCISVSIWLFGAFMMLTSKEDVLAIFWDRIVYMGVVFIPALMYHISVIFAKLEQKQRKTLLIGYFISFIFLILSGTNYFVEDLYKYSWGTHTQARFFHHLFLVFFATYIFLFFCNLYRYYKKTSGMNRVQAKYMLMSFGILNIGAVAYLPAYGVDVYPIIAYLAETIGAVILAYAILKHHLMNIRVVTTELFTGLIILVLLVQTIIAPSFDEFLIRGGVLLFVTTFGFFLIRGTIREIENLEKLSKAKSEFVSIVSHQLRTPLTATKGYISMLLEGSYGKLSKKTERVMNNVYESNERLIRLVNNFLNISRIEAGKIKMTYEKVSLEEVIESVINELKLEIKKKNIYLKWEQPKKPLPKILIDAEKVRQIILNVIDNSVRYTKQGGIVIKVKNLKFSVLISITDTGEGMTAEEITKVFYSFSRGGAGNETHTEGAGLGLYIARKFAEMHQGRIWSESKGRGKGSAFYIELPKVQK